MVGYDVTALGGYTCGWCGGWVKYGVKHECPCYTIAVGEPTRDWGRVANALERIAAALEKLAGVN